VILTSLRVKVDKEDVIIKIDYEDAKLSNVSFIIINAMSDLVKEYRKRRFNSNSIATIVKLRNLVFAKSCIIT